MSHIRHPKKKLRRFAANPSRLGWPALAVAIASVVALPIGWLATYIGRSSGGTWQHLWETVLAGYVINTFLSAVGVAAGALLVGVPSAWLVTMHRFPGSRQLRWMLLLPLAIPTYLLAYAATDVLQFSGPVQTWLRNSMDWSRQDYWFPDTRTLPGAIVILTLGLYPYVYLATRTALLEQSGCVLEAARMLGAGSRRSFFRITLPLIRPSIVAGLSLVMMETMAEFGAMDYCAVDTLATGIYRTWFSRGSLVAAAQLSMCLLSMIAVILTLETASRGSAKFHQSTSRRRTPQPTRMSGWRSVMALLFCALPVLFGFVLPVVVFAQMSWQSGDARAGELLGPLAWHSVKLAALSAAFAVVLATVVAYAGRLQPSVMMKTATRVAGIGYAIPGGVIAIGVLGVAWWMEEQVNIGLESLIHWSPGLFISGTIAAVLIGYQTRFLAVAMGIIISGLARIRPSLDDASRVLGSPPRMTLVRVHVPLLRSSLLSAALLVFVDVLKELPATLILRPFNHDTLAVRVYQLASDERLSEASTAALAIIAAGLIPVIVLSRWMQSKGQGLTNGQ